MDRAYSIEALSMIAQKVGGDDGDEGVYEAIEHLLSYGVSSYSVGAALQPGQSKMVWSEQLSRAHRNLSTVEDEDGDRLTVLKILEAIRDEKL